jgi:hypothetical protein
MTIETLSYWVAIVVGLLSAIALSWSAVRYVQIRHAEIRQQRFANLDRLIRIYAGWSPDTPRGPVALAHQLMAAFELRNYPEYLPLFMYLHEYNKFNGDHANEINNMVASSIDCIGRQKWWRAA